MIENKDKYISDVIRKRINKNNTRYFANDNISEFIESEDEIEDLIDEVAEKFQV